MFPDHKHEGQLFKAFRKHDELKKRLQAMEQNHEEKLREHEDNRFYTMMDMKRAYDDKLKDVRKSYCCSPFSNLQTTPRIIIAICI